MSQVPKASSAKFLNAFGNPTNTSISTQSQVPQYPDKGVKFAGYAKVPGTGGGYTLKRQNFQNYTLTNQDVVDTQHERINYKTHDFYCTDIFIQYSRVPGNLGTPRSISLMDGNTISNSVSRFTWYIPYTSWVAAADLGQNWTADAERGDVIELWEQGIHLHFGVPIPFIDRYIFLGSSGSASFWILNALTGFDEEK